MTPPSKIQFPETINKIYLIAICGTGMAALACLLQELGYAISGSDQHVYPPMSDFLRAKGIPIFEGYHADHLNPQPDLVVVGNAVSKTNPEVQAMEALGLPYCSMPQAINRFAARGKMQIVVTGTHGKTTTSSFIAWMLYCAGLDPSFLIGGIVSNFNSNYRAGKGSWIVLEGDEYDTAFFDKGPKFWHYSPSVAVLTSVEFDHADIFKDLEQIISVFGEMLARLPTQAALVAFDGDANIAGILPRSRGQHVGYGYDGQSQWRLGAVRIEPPKTLFDVYFQDQLFARFSTHMIGIHNLLNLLAGIAVGHHLKLSIDVIARALETFKGTRRRQEIRGVKHDIVVIDDFAHHPTAVRATIDAVKQFYGRRRLIAVFEPRTNTSRRNIFQNVYPQAFSNADLICIRQAPMLEKIPVDERFSSEKLVAELTSRRKEALYFPDTDGIIAYLSLNARPGDVVLIMSNGGFDNIHQRLLDSLDAP
jgi:UDP-N-acetylmuramate: L-alanyl-gamma-D-glutamyl-meso-diaminopimelate ligase